MGHREAHAKIEQRQGAPAPANAGESCFPETVALAGDLTSRNDPIDSASIFVLRKQSSACAGVLTIGSFSLNDVLMSFISLRRGSVRGHPREADVPDSVVSGFSRTTSEVVRINCVRDRIGRSESAGTRGLSATSPPACSAKSACHG